MEFLKAGLRLESWHWKSFEIVLVLLLLRCASLLALTALISAEFEFFKENPLVAVMLHFKEVILRHFPSFECSLFTPLLLFLFAAHSAFQLEAKRIL
mmetsp:Transcript_9985/g.7510  ORF Transcript_9985/g.7510 Transcript_9985/m.7510 type:complete len:97 (-) Transcript_9985:14-304(-)